MQLRPKLVAFVYERAVNQPLYAAEDTLDFMNKCVDEAEEEGLISPYEALLLSLQESFGHEETYEYEDVVKFLKKYSYKEFYPHKDGNWDEAYRQVVRECKKAAEEGELCFPKWFLRLWDIAIMAAKWRLEDVIKNI